MYIILLSISLGALTGVVWYLFEEVKNLKKEVFKNGSNDKS